MYQLGPESSCGKTTSQPAPTPWEARAIARGRMFDPASAGAGKAQHRSTFRYDKVFGSFATQEEVFDSIMSGEAQA